MGAIVGKLTGKKQEPQRNYELERQMSEMRAAEGRRADELAAQQAETAYKQAKGLYGSRSLFGRAGGRGYFDTI
tara:strand:+ start:608 stop:829 length:222 start_codon:yes stop_codon:yes gene_type:complete